MAKHIQEMKIEKYRGISHLELKNLNDINIFTGDNNSGKTSVLEIISSTDNPRNFGTWARVSREVNRDFRKKFFYTGFLNMFPVDEEEKSVCYEYLDKSGKNTRITLQAKIEETQIHEKEMLRINGLVNSEKERAIEDENIIDTKCLHLEIYLDGEKVDQYKLYDFQTRVSMFVEGKTSFVRTVYVSPFEHANRTLYLNNVLSDSGLYEEMIKILKQFDENIISINAVYTNENSNMAEYMVLTKNHKRALPLNVYGDGMKKAILLLSAVLEAKDGILLLDEFETAIHTSAMDSIFSWILENAKKLNVQVFLTSHSKEAIDKILKCNPNLQENINLYTLYKSEDKNLVRCMGCLEAIKAQDNLGLELR